MGESTQQFQSVTKRFAQLSPSEFRSEVERTWQAGQQILNTVCEQVEQQQIQPLDGAKIASCVAGTLLGYEEFHPRGIQDSPQLTDALMWSVTGASREREYAGSRQ